MCGEREHILRKCKFSQSSLELKILSIKLSLHGEGIGRLLGTLEGGVLALS